MAGKTFKGIKSALSRLTGQEQPMLTFGLPHLVSDDEGWVGDMIGTCDEVRERYKERYQQLMEEKNRSIGSSFDFIEDTTPQDLPSADRGNIVPYILIPIFHFHPISAFIYILCMSKKPIKS